MARLRDATDDLPGIRRVRPGRGFDYQHPDGRPVRDPTTLTRIRRMAVPRAWRSVWICPAANGYIQATGRDLEKTLIRVGNVCPPQPVVGLTTMFDRHAAVAGGAVRAGSEARAASCTT